MQKSNEFGIKTKKELNARSYYQLHKVLANTLQGRIYLAQDQNKINKVNENQNEKEKINSEWVAIKETWRELVRRGKSRDGHKVTENFERERLIHTYLSKLPESNQNNGYVKCIESWEDENCFYLVMEHCGGGELFDFIRDNHGKKEMVQLMNTPFSLQQCQIVSNDWSKCVQFMFRQLVDVVSWMHSNGIAHLDLSLENTMLVAAPSPFDKEKNKNNDDDNNNNNKEIPIQIKIIDFGVAQSFKPNQKFCHKVGKIAYMSPEVYNKSEYYADKADIWSLGVMLFMMLVGAPPYEFPHLTNPAFRFIISGRLKEILLHWRRLSLIPIDALDVMEKIFKPENDRITMSELRRHPFVGLDFSFFSSFSSSSSSSNSVLNNGPVNVSLNTTIETPSSTLSPKSTSSTPTSTLTIINNESSISTEPINTQVGIKTETTTSTPTLTPTSTKRETRTQSEQREEEGEEIRNETLTIKIDAIPSLQTSKAKEVALQLRDTVGVDNLRSFVIDIEQRIADAKTSQSSGAVYTTTENLQSFQQVDPPNSLFQDHQFVDELNKLLQVAKATLSINNTSSIKLNSNDKSDI